MHWSFFVQTMDTSFETGIIVIGAGVGQTSKLVTTIVVGDCLIHIIPFAETFGLFSVPAPSQHPRGVRRGFLFGPPVSAF